MTNALCCGDCRSTEHRSPSRSRLTGQSWTISSDSFTESYTYDADNGSLASVSAATGETVTYNYDALKRQTGIQVSNGNTVLYQTARSFTPGSGTNQTTPLTHFYNYKTASGSVITGWLYGYDAAGNISQVRESVSPYRVLVAYAYDAQDQLTSETRYTYVGSNTTPSSTVTSAYTYDSAGNLLSGGGITYTYGDGDWIDLLTQIKVGNTTRAISYSGGNPNDWYNGTTYTNLTWTQGRRLAGLTAGGTATSYAYDMEGVRTSKTVGSVTHEYVTQSGKVVQESYGSIILQFFYDAAGRPFALKYSNDSGSTWTTMYYVLNLQGDVVALIGGFSGSNYNTYATYQYDAWGKVLSATSTYTNVPKYAHIAEINPLRYRGYYYDSETGFYYLQSRYYDPIVKRFLNADSYGSTGQGFLGYNTFAYCGNNPVKNIDLVGCKYIENHPIKTNEEDPNGFSLDVSEEFLDPYVCLYYSYELVSAYGIGGKYYDMDAERIALEIYAHTVLYYQGIYMCNHFSESVAAPNYSDTSLPITIGPSVVESALYDVGEYFIEHGKDIYVNDNETTFRMGVYMYIWSKNTSNIGRALTKMLFLETRRPKGPVKQMVK